MKIILIFLLGLTCLQAQQNADPLVFTVGKTYATNGGTTHHNYLLWQPGDASTTIGKRFAVYAKAGAADAPTSFSRLAIQSLQTSPSAIRALLKLGEKFDHNASSLPARITALHAEAQSIIFDPDNAPTEVTLEVAQRLAQVIAAAQEDAEILQSLLSLGRAHPGVMMVLGHGFAGVVSGDSISTYEVREVNEADSDIRIIGRVTLDAASPSQLVAPGRPHEVPIPVDPNYQLAASAKNHLNARFRWATPDALREISPLTYGFNLYRVPEEIVGDPDTITTEAQALVNGVRVNNLPIASRGLLTDAQAADPTFENDNHFYTDLKDPPEDPFQNGDTFYYYVAARDIAGHPGPLSPATRVVMCDRLPPSQPSIVSVDNVFDIQGSDPASGTGQQHLRVVIRQVPEDPIENRAYKYRIYRWQAATDWQRHGADPEFNCIGEVDHQEGELYVTFDDDDPTDLDTDGIAGPDSGSPVCHSQDDFPMGKTYWYTARAVDNAACDPPNYSGHSGAVYGVPRDRVGPGKPQGWIEYCQCFPRVTSNDVTEGRKINYDLSRTFPGFVVRMHRLERERLLKKVCAFEVQYGLGQAREFDARFARIQSFSGMESFKDVVIPFRLRANYLVRVRTILKNGVRSAWNTRPVEVVPVSPSVLPLYEFRASIFVDCIPQALPPGGTPPPHDPFGLDDIATGICGTVNIPDDAREVRIYRRVGRGSPFQLISRMSGDELPSNYEWKESAPVLQHGAEACYFAQLFDEHGNASPLVKQGCVTVDNPDLGTPVLEEPKSTVINNSSLVELSWFCDPVGVDRFEVLVAAEGMAKPQVSSPQLIDPPFEEVPNDENEAADLSFRIFQTPGLSSGFGDGGNFKVLLAVPSSHQMHYMVRAIGPRFFPNSELAAQRALGPCSNRVSGQWVPPSPPLQDVIPWPARPLSNLTEVEMDISCYTLGSGPFHAHAITPAQMDFFQASAAILVGVFPAVRPINLDGSQGPPNEAIFPGTEDPFDWIFSYATQPVCPVASEAQEKTHALMVYRHQVPSDRFPDAKANLVQVTPLIDRISYREVQEGRRAIDPFFIFHTGGTGPEITGFPVPVAGKFSRQGGYETSLFIDGVEYLEIADFHRSTMWVRDPHPVASGASYQYLIVNFDDRGEIARIIPTNVIQH